MYKISFKLIHKGDSLGLKLNLVNRIMINLVNYNHELICEKNYINNLNLLKLIYLILYTITLHSIVDTSTFIL